MHAILTPGRKGRWATTIHFATLSVALLQNPAVWADDSPAEKAEPKAKSVATPGGVTNRPTVDSAFVERRQRAREIVEQHREEQRGLTEKLRQARRELELAAQADPINEATVREKASVVGKIEGDLALLRGKQYRALRSEGLQPNPVDALSRTNNRLHQIMPRPKTNSPATPSATLPLKEP